MACCKEGCENSVCQYGELQSGEVIKPERCMPMNKADDLKKGSCWALGWAQQQGASLHANNEPSLDPVSREGLITVSALKKPPTPRTLKK